MRTFTFSLLAAAGGLLMTSLVGGATIDFDTADQYAGNFRVLSSSGNTPTQLVTSGAGYVSLSTGATPSSATILYDTTPGDGAATKNVFNLTQGQTVTFSADVAFKFNNSSFGVYIIDSGPTGETDTTAYLALFNIDYLGGANLDDQIRFFTGAKASGSGAGVVKQNTGHASVMTRNNPPKKVTVTYGIDANDQGILTMTVGDFSQSYAIADGLTSVEIGMRLSITGINTADNFIFDNVEVSVPEPGSMGLIGLGMVSAMLGRRRRATR